MKKSLLALMFLFCFAVSAAGQRDSMLCNGVETALIESIRKSIMDPAGDYLMFLDSCDVLYPGNDAVKYELSQAYYFAGNMKKSLEFAKEADSLNSRNVWYKFILAQIYVRIGELEKACEEYEKIIDLDPYSDELYFSAAQIYRMIPDIPSAVRILNSYEDKFGFSDELFAQKIDWIYDYIKIDTINGNKMLLAESEKYYEADKKNPLRVIFLADTYDKTGYSKAADKLVKRHIKKYGEDGIISFFIAEKMFYRGDSYMFVEYSMKGINDENTDQKYKYAFISNMISLYRDYNNYGISLNEFKSCINSIIVLFKNKYPDSRDAALMYCDWLNETGDPSYTQALEDFVKIFKDEYYVYNELMMNFLREEKYDTLSFYAETAMDYFPDKTIPYLMKAIPLIVSENYNDALIILKKGKSTVQDYSYIASEFYSAIGDCYYHIGEADTAFSYFEKSIRINPDNFSLLNNYAYYLANSGKDLDNAEKMSYKALYSDLNNPTYIDTYAWVLFVKGDYSQAKYYMKKAIEKSGGDVNGVYLDHYGDILNACGEREEAEKNWRKALDSEDVDKESILKKLNDN